jgi:hypothetical protein
MDTTVELHLLAPLFYMKKWRRHQLSIGEHSLHMSGTASATVFICNVYGIGGKVSQSGIQYP